MSRMPLRSEKALHPVPGVERSPYLYSDLKGKKVNEIWYEGSAQAFTDEEIAASDEKFLRENKEALEQVEADGFIRYPIYAQNIYGELVEKEAWLHPTFEPSCSEGFLERHGMSTNIYVPSYERAGSAQTLKMLDGFGVKNYYICVDPTQYLKYKAVYPVERLVIRDVTFREPAMLAPSSNLKRPMAMAGHAPLCNFTLALSRSLGESHFTFSDDDFLGLAMKAHKGTEVMKATEKYDKDNFYRCSKIKEEYGFSFQEFWHRLEVLTTKIRNPGFVGLEKFGTVFALPICFRTGTRVYSFYITNNATQVDHYGWQNNDVITSMELSRHGLVNLLAEGICYNSEPTQSGNGGQADMYRKFGSLDKGKILVRAHPNWTRIIYRYSRVHHSGDFNGYNKLRVLGNPLPQQENPV